MATTCAASTGCARSRPTAHRAPPDEIPPDRPKVRLVLDTFFPEAFIGNVEAAAEVPDAMVTVWLGVARALTEKGHHRSRSSRPPRTRATRW